MASVTIILVIIAVCLAILTTFIPVVLMLFVNRRIEQRYNCKLKIEVASRRLMPFYSYYKYFNPGNTIALAYLFNSKKVIQKNKCLHEINYNIDAAPKIEIIICVFCYLVLLMTIILSVTAFILMKIYDIE